MVAASYTRGSSWPGFEKASTVSYIGRWILYHWATWETPSHSRVLTNWVTSVWGSEGGTHGSWFSLEPSLEGFNDAVRPEGHSAFTVPVSKKLRGKYQVCFWFEGFWAAASQVRKVPKHSQWPLKPHPHPETPSQDCLPLSLSVESPSLQVWVLVLLHFSFFGSRLYLSFHLREMEQVGIPGSKASPRRHCSLILHHHQWKDKGASLGGWAFSKRNCDSCRREALAGLRRTCRSW